MSMRPPVRLDGKVDDVFGLWLDAGEFEHIGERHAGPLGDIRPAFFAGELGDLAAGWITLELSERKGGGTIHHSVDGETPVGEASGLELLNASLGGAISFERSPGNLIASELACHQCRVSSLYEA